MRSPQDARYRAELPEDIGPFKKLLHEYAHIPLEELDAHIHQIVSLTPDALQLRTDEH